MRGNIEWKKISYKMVEIMRGIRKEEKEEIVSEMIEIGFEEIEIKIN